MHSKICSRVRELLVHCFGCMFGCMLCMLCSRLRLSVVFSAHSFLCLLLYACFWSSFVRSRFLKIALSRCFVGWLFRSSITLFVYSFTKWLHALVRGSFVYRLCLKHSCSLDPIALIFLSALPCTGRGGGWLHIRHRSFSFLAFDSTLESTFSDYSCATDWKLHLRLPIIYHGLNKSFAFLYYNLSVSRDAPQ